MLYPVEDFLTVLKVNLVAPTYWALEMVAKIAESRRARGLKRWAPPEHVEGAVIFIGSVSSHGIAGQIAYSATKAGLDGVNATLMKEAIYYGVRCAVIHPGFTDTPMVRALGDEYIDAKDPAADAVEAAGAAGRDRRRHLLYDFRLGNERRSLGGRRLASAGGLILFALKRSARERSR